MPFLPSFRVARHSQWCMCKVHSSVADKTFCMVHAMHVHGMPMILATHFRLFIANILTSSDDGPQL
jgi:hypothetical protein